MSKTAARLTRAERRALALSPRATRTSSRPALLASILAKAERAALGEALEPADWTNAPRDVIAHRDKLLEWVARQRQG